MLLSLESESQIEDRTEKSQRLIIAGSIWASGERFVNVMIELSDFSFGRTGAECRMNVLKIMNLWEDAETFKGGGPNVGVHSAPGWSGLLSARKGEYGVCGILSNSSFRWNGSDFNVS
jgi:hypothetical protein